MTAPECPDWLVLLAQGAAAGRIPAGGLIWEEPPPSTAGQATGRPLNDNVDDAPAPPMSVVAAITAALRARPLCWARVYTGSRVVAQNMILQARAGYRGWHYAGQFEATRRTVDGEAAVWARYTPLAFANVLIETALDEEHGDE